MVIRLTLVLFIFSGAASASEAIKAFKEKNYQAVANTYNKSKIKNFSQNELAVVSQSFKKLRMYREDIALNSRVINSYYRKPHEKLIKSIKRGDTVDIDDYPKALPVLYWNIFADYGAIIKGYSSNSPQVEKDHTNFKLYSKILSELEFREGKVDKFNDLIISHRQYLTEKIYRFKTSWNVQYVSWQNESTLSGNGIDTTLIMTNRGFCAGGDAGFENHLYHFYLDGCLLYGAGNVKNVESGTAESTYKQQNVSAMGLKFGPGASLIVSSTKSRIGFKIPILYSTQKLEQPDASSGFSIKDESSMSILTTVYSRWQFDKWYFHTEFGKYILKELTFWSLGVGKEF